MTSTKRSSKRKLLISSDSDEDIKTTERDVNTRRQSSRIYDKQHRPEFKLPTREKVWNDIGSMKTASKLKNLTPRKTVNNFTKVYNTYNYDDYEDTSDDEISTVETSESDEEDIHQKKRQHRVKNFHKRLKVHSSSSDEDCGNADKGDIATNSDALQEEQDKIDKVPDGLGNEHSCNDKNGKLEPSKASDGESDENVVFSPCKKGVHARNRSLLESDDENSSQKDNDDDRDSGSNSDSQSSSGSDLTAESSKCRFANQKIKQTNLFKKFREAQAKKKKSISNT